MLITAWYQGTHVQLVVPDGHLVYDGSNFVKPEFAKQVILLTQPVVAVNPELYPIQNTNALSIFNICVQIVCNVISAVPSGDMLATVVNAVDVLGGQCLCGITSDPSCFQTELRPITIEAAP